MNMKRDNAMTDESTAAQEWLDQLDPNDPGVKVRDGQSLRLVREAADAAERAGDDLHARVAEARAAGESWGTIGMVLGVSRQAAQQRFGPRSPTVHSPLGAAALGGSPLDGRIGGGFLNEP